MAFGLQERDSAEEFESFDPLPYSGGYDIAAIYGHIKAAAPQHSYPRRTEAQGRFEGSYDESVPAPYASAKPSSYGRTDSNPKSDSQPQGYGYGGHTSGYGVDQSSSDDAGFSSPRPESGSSGYGKFQKQQCSEHKPSQGYGKFGYADQKAEKADYEEDEAVAESGYGFGGAQQSTQSFDDAGYSSPRPESGSSGHGNFQKQQFSEHKPSQEYGKFSYADQKAEKADYAEDEAVAESGYGLGGAQQSTQGYGRRPQSQWGEGYGSAGTEGRRPGEFGRPVEVNPDAGGDRRRKQDDECEKPTYEGHHRGKDRHEGRHEGHHQRRHGEDSEFGGTEDAAYGESGVYRPYGGGRRADDEPVNTGEYGGSGNYGRHGGRRHDEEELAEFTGELSLDGESRPYRNQPRRRDEYQY